MTPWFTLPIVVPVGLVVMAAAFAIYRAYVDPDHPQFVAVKGSGSTSLPAELPRRWRA